MNLRRQIEKRLSEIGMTDSMLTAFSAEVSDLINGRGVLVVRRKSKSKDPRDITVWFCERFCIAELFQKEIR